MSYDVEDAMPDACGLLASVASGKWEASVLAFAAEMGLWQAPNRL